MNCMSKLLNTRNQAQKSASCVIALVEFKSSQSECVLSEARVVFTPQRPVTMREWKGKEAGASEGLFLDLGADCTGRVSV